MQYETHISTTHILQADLTCMENQECLNPVGCSQKMSNNGKMHWKWLYLLASYTVTVMHSTRDRVTNYTNRQPSNTYNSGYYREGHAKTHT